MTDTLAPVDRARLGQLLALAEGAANPADGERLAALAAAERLLGRHGLRLRDLPGLMGGEPEAVAWRPPSSAWRTAAADCLNQDGRLTPWEREFLASLARFRWLSERQQAVLGRIARRVLGAEGARASA